MIPIFIMAGAALLVALIKWFSLWSVRKPSQRPIKALPAAVAAHDLGGAQEQVGAIAGPTAAMIDEFEADAKIRHAQLLVGQRNYKEALPLLRRHCSSSRATTYRNILNRWSASQRGGSKPITHEINQARSRSA